VCHEGPPKPSAICPEIARELDAVAAKAMAKEAMERYGSPQALADDIGRYLAGLPVSAHRGSRIYQVGKFVRRNRLAVTLSAAALVLITAGVLAIVRQERIAERRFQQVRKLANSVIYELHDGIATLPGSTEVRRLLIARATEYLHALSQEAAGDTALQTELAMAYARVANVQGNPGWANLGDSPAALGTYAKAKSILEAVVAREPSKREPRMRLAQVNLDTASVQVFLRRAGDARVSANAGLANWKLLLDRNPKDQEAMSGVAAAYFSLADSSSQAGNEDESLTDRRRALEIYEALLAAHPGENSHQRNVALCLKTLGGTLVRRKQRDEARAVYRRALELDRQRVAAHPNDAVAKLDLSFDYGELGVTYDDDPLTALELFSQSLALRRELAAADPRDARVQGRLAFGVLRMGGQHFRLGHYDEALKHFAEGVEISKALLAKSPGDLAAKSTLASGLYDVGDAAIKLGDRRRACDSYRASLATYADLASRNPMGTEEQAKQDSLRRTMAANCGM
jgi:tetratricopeptide (TPR) repeat protein